MDAEYFAFYNRTNAEVVEHFGAVFPRIRVAILSHCFIVEPIDGCDLSRLVVTSQQGDVLGVFQLQAQQELETLHWVKSSVHVIAHEDVFGCWDLSTLVEQFQKVMELPVDVSANRNWSFDWLHVALLYQNFLYFLAQNTKLSFW